ncbi:hypothetical protein DQ244_17300 [Blastococcus sp. TBT05-19]|uniref:hypothetical protein n=1 Tax=Blastococcus sp. TBT05-19 TaxID=2250581 RepID=UPI000DEB00D6|nr:hypothetical protein [Blastococcus sp. TBT05-19]RBY87095.1 hypothetical protein DQ244_17300 [Blastococcus sp. TBT05-19]
MESYPPGIVVEHERSWAYFPADCEKQGSWQEAIRHLDQGTARGRARRFTKRWLPVLRDTLDDACVGVFLRSSAGLYLPPSAVVRLTRYGYDPSVPAAQAVDEVLQELLRPENQRVSPPLIEPVPGSAVGAVRVRHQVAVDGGGSSVQEHALWVVPVAGAVWALSTSFTDPVGGVDGLLSELDALANGMRDPMRNADVPFVVLRPEIPEPAAAGGLLVGNLPTSSLTIDRERGEVTWVDDAIRQRRVQLPLGTGPGEVAGLLRAIFPPTKIGHPRLPDVFRVMLVDDSGRVLARSAARPASWLDEMWPVELLEASGLPVQTRRFDNTRLLHKAHPGAAPLWVFTGGLWLLMLWGLLGAALLLAVGGALAGNPIWSDWSGFFGG